MRRWFPGHLTAGEGTKNVCVCFMDKQNNWSADPGDTGRDGIVVDSTIPTGTIEIHVAGVPPVAGDIPRKLPSA